MFHKLVNYHPLDEWRRGRRRHHFKWIWSVGVDCIETQSTPVQGLNSINLCTTPLTTSSLNHHGLVNLNVCNFSHLTLLTRSINFRTFRCHAAMPVLSVQPCPFQSKWSRAQFRCMPCECDAIPNHTLRIGRPSDGRTDGQTNTHSHIVRRADR